MHELILDRLTRLNDVCRRLIAVAAAIGREFDFSFLARAARLDETTVAEGVEELVRRRIFHWIGDSCEFTHDRVREVAYGEMSATTRCRHHRDIAEALEALYTDNLDPFAQTLAFHYREGQEWSKAAFYLRQAGRQAIARAAHREAATWFTQAVHAGRSAGYAGEHHIREAIDLRFELRDALTALADFEALDSCLHELETLANRLQDPTRIVRTACYRSGHLSLAGDQAEAVAAAKRGKDLADAIGERSLQVMTRLFLGQAWYTGGAYTEATNVFRELTEGLHASYSREYFDMMFLPSVRAGSWLAWCLAERGDFAEAMSYGVEALRLARDSGRPHDLLHGYRGVGRVLAIRGEFAAAMEFLEPALDLARRAASSPIFHLTAAIMAYAYAMSGRVEDAGRLLQESPPTGGPSRTMTELIRWRSQVETLAGLHPVTEVAQALSLARDRRQQGDHAYLLALLADLGRETDETAAHRHYVEADQLARLLGMRPLLGRCHIGMATLLGRRGERAAAKGHLDAAAKTFQSLGSPYWLARTQTIQEAAG